MHKSTNEQKEHIYNLAIGTYNLEMYSIPGSEYIQDEFAKGKPCDVLYEEVYNAKENICQRLDVAEDRDVETIIDNLLTIAKILSLKMYEYGEDKVHLKIQENSKEYLEKNE